jgi:hypothetical protein
MERQAGLGRSLEDVLDSLTPADPDVAAPGRVLFEPEALEQQLDQLMGDIRDLRERVQHLVGMVPPDALSPPGAAKQLELVQPSVEVEKKKSKKKKKKKKKKKSENKGRKRAADHRSAGAT